MLDNKEIINIISSNWR